MKGLCGVLEVGALLEVVGGAQRKCAVGARGWCVGKALCRQSGEGASWRQASSGGLWQ